MSKFVAIALLASVALAAILPLLVGADSISRRNAAICGDHSDKDECNSCCKSNYYSFGALFTHSPTCYCIELDVRETSEPHDELVKKKNGYWVAIE